MEQTLGKRIAAARKRCGMTQDQLAEKLGVTPQAVSKWENDLSCPDINTLPLLSDIFGISVDALLGREEPVQAEVIPDDEPEEQPRHRIEFEYDGSDHDFTVFHTRSLSTLGLAVFVLLLGGLMLFGGITGKNWGFWSLAWPAAMSVIGLIGMLRRFSFVKLGLFVFGTAFLLENTGAVHIPYGSKLVLPACLLILGVSLLVGFLRKGKRGTSVPGFRRKNGEFVSDYDEKDGSFSVSCSFGSTSRRIQIPVLRGGSADCSFGELTVDLSGCSGTADGCPISLNCSFGELRLLVPRRMQAAVREDQAFGSVKVVGSPAPGASDLIQVSADVSFGEIVIQYI